MIKHILLILVLVIMLVPMPTQAQEIESCTAFDITTLKIGASVELSCDSDCVGGSIWGTGIYTSDSDICTAAVHSGIITAEDGGAFTLFVVEGLASYEGSEANGIASSSWDEWGTSFTFMTQPLELDWSSTAQGLGEGLLPFHLASCPAEGLAGTVWGTEIYTDDSSVCTAAAHAGIITIEEGGEFFLSVVDGAENYTGSSANGVDTLDFGSWETSFVVTPFSLDIEWSTTGIDLVGPAGTLYRVHCPAEGLAGTVWGTEIYTDDSSICTAGVHNGALTPENGGRFFVVIAGETESNEGSEQNGVISNDWESGWERNFGVGYVVINYDE